MISKVKREELDHATRDLIAHKEAALTAKRLQDSLDSDSDRLTVLQAELAGEKLDSLKAITQDATEQQKAFSGRAEGMLIEVLRMVTFKIKVMDYIAKNVFADGNTRNLRKGLRSKIMFQ